MAIQIEWLRQVDRLIIEEATVVDCKSLRASRKANNKYSLPISAACTNSAVVGKEQPFITRAALTLNILAGFQKRWIRVP